MYLPDQKRNTVEKVKNEIGLEISGIAASPGLAIGKAYIIKKDEIVSTGILLKEESDVLKEIEKFGKAVHASVEELETIKNNEALKRTNEEIEILETHIEFLTDPQIRDDVFEKIKWDKKNASDAVIEVIQNAVIVFKTMEDKYMNDRAADIQDIGDRILKNLNQSENKRQQNFGPNTILFAEDISPSDAITIDMSCVVGFATRVGGKTSHTAILAKSKNIPAVLGCGNILNEVEDNDLIILNGSDGKVIINPDEVCLEAYRIKKEAYHQKLEFLASLKHVDAKTSDGVKIELRANISTVDDMEDSLEYGATGAGLFRTELLFMNRNSFPSEEDQFVVYKKVALKAKGNPVIVRTIDIGGDKPLEYLRFPKEENPFLGYRGIRFCLDRKDIFITQLKAILRASIFGDVKIMFPMISNIQELRLAKEMLEEAKSELKKNTIDFDSNIQVGIMIEVPSAAITADILAKEADFFSIGTNDLCQYTLAVDRGNEKVKDLYDPYDPAVLRLIKYVIEQAHKHKINVGMCGEFASDPLAALLLLGMGLTEFSMSAASIPSIKNVIINNSYAKARDVYENVMTMDNSKSIVDYLRLLK
jgi:phosphotransferase system enzyme I (PtsI)